jgi:hypothetical protein
MDTISFESMPQLLYDLNQKVESLLKLQKNPQATETDELFSIQQLQNYLPERPALQTIYGWVNIRIIPYQKHGKRLYFRKSEIDQWLRDGRKVK